MNFITAGESHGPQLTGILEGIPAGLKLDVDAINNQLSKRQGGYGRGNRQNIEHDVVQITGGVRHKITLGSPISLTVMNKDHKHWNEIMDPTAEETAENSVRKVSRPRPGHADLVGGMKYNHRDFRNVLERSSARETAMRVAIGAICKQLLAQLGINVVGYVKKIGSINDDVNQILSVAEIVERIKNNDLRVLNEDRVDAVHNMIDQTKRDGDTLGGIIKVVAENVPAGLGSYTGWNQKFDARLAFAAMGVNAMKGVEIGEGFAASTKFGSQVMDPIDWNEEKGWFRDSDNLGGFEGGMTNGMPIIVQAAMKPIPTLYKPLKSVDVNSKEVSKANIERSDVTAIVPASLVIESVIAIEIANIITETFDGSNIERLTRQLNDYRQEIKEF